MATVTITQTPQSIGAERCSVATVAFDSSYPTGGEAAAAASLGLRRVTKAICTITAVGGTINVANARYDVATGKVLLFDETPAQVANEANVEGVKVQIVAFGK